MNPVSPLDPASAVYIEQTVDVDLVRRAWLQALGLNLDAELAGIDVLHLCRCASSQLRFFWPMAAGSPRLYESLQRFSWYYRDAKWEYEAAARHVKLGSRWLDVGCGNGGFLEIAGLRGGEAHGIDFNEKAIQCASDRGLRASSRTLQDLIDAGELFDGVTAFQVLEHVLQPLAVLKRMAALVRPGGLLIIAVPDSSGWLAHSGELLDTPPHHVTRWNPAALQYLTKLLPLELQSIEIEPLQEVHLYNYISAQLHPVSSLEVVVDRLSILDRVARRFIAWRLCRTGRFHRLPGMVLMSVYRISEGGLAS